MTAPQMGQRSTSTPGESLRIVEIRSIDAQTTVVCWFILPLTRGVSPNNNLVSSTSRTAHETRWGLDMSANIELVELPVFQALVVSRKTTMAQVVAAMGESLPASFQLMMAAGGAPSAPPIVRWTSMDGDALEFEAGVPFSGDVTAPEGASIIEVGGPCLKITHVGPYDTMRQTWGLMHQHLANSEYEAREAPFEQYMTDPSTEPDSSKWITDIYWPVRTT